jgi:signal transduction histidine kinase
MWRCRWCRPRAYAGQAEESVRNKTIFIQNLSHQIRTPLNVITGFANILLDNIAYGSHWGNQWFLR